MEAIVGMLNNSVEKLELYDGNIDQNISSLGQNINSRLDNISGFQWSQLGTLKDSIGTVNILNKPFGINNHKGVLMVLLHEQDRFMTLCIGTCLCICLIYI